MTLMPTAPSGGGDRRAHPGELRLRRHRLGELAASEQDEVATHLADCADCRVRQQGLQDEQRAFSTQISFERFAGGVERAARVPRIRPSPRRAVLAGGGLAVAAAAALLLVVRPGGGPESDSESGGNRLKGETTGALIQVASLAGEQKAVEPGAILALRPGDRLRLGYRSDRPRHLIALSVDDTGAVTPLYPESGDSIAIAAGSSFQYLPDSVQLTGAGRERVYVILADRPFTLESAVIAAGAEHTRRGGDLTVMGALHIGSVPAAEIFTWLFGKP